MAEKIENPAAMLAHHEQDIAEGFLRVTNGLKAIKTNNYYLVVAPTFTEYLRKRWGKSESWYKQLQATARTAQQMIDDFGITFATHYAVREYRALMAQWVKAGKVDELVEAFVDKAHAVAGDKPLQAKHITAIGDTLATVTRTGGYVDGVYGTEMTAFDAVVGMHVDEAFKRQNGHINGNTPVYTQLLRVGDELAISGLPVGTPVRVRVMVVEEFVHG